MRCPALKAVPAVALWVCVTLASSVPTGAAERVNKDAREIAIRGYDAVAYFTEGRPVAGTPEFEHVWQNATWRFSTADHRDLFSGTPRRYAPRYGGFCAGGMTLGRFVPIDPKVWVIVDDKLYLSRTKLVRRDFVRDADDNIIKADGNWRRLGQAE